MLTLSGGCVECDAPSGITIERLAKSDIHYRERDDFTEGELKFEKWVDTEGVAVVTGLLRHEFVAVLKSHLIGVSSDEMGEGGVIDEAGAEVILEEMYRDAVVKPRFPKDVEASS